jgi:hypothetical protein
MSTIITRIGKGTPLTNAEVDANFTNLNTDKVEAADTRTLTNKTISGANNTLSNIGNASLTNSSITFGSTAQALGSTVSALNGVSIGASTASTGAFTTLTTSSTVTHNGGTANGVAYLNSSKVLTTGSALTFDGNTLKAPNVNVSDSNWVGWGSDRTRLVGNSSTNFLAAFIDNSEQMRLTSTGLGIGTSSPSEKLDVAGSGNQTSVVRTTDTSGVAVGRFTARFGSGGTASVVDLRAGSGYAYLLAETNNPLLFGTNNAERMRIDSSGNLLVGDTSGIGGSRFLVKSATTNGSWVSIVTNTSNAIMFGVLDNGGIVTGTSAASPYNNTTGSAANLFVASDGLLYRSTSSLKYKTDVQDATHGLAEVMALRPVTYKGKNDGGKVFGGLIAEEVHEAGLTEFVQYAEDGTPDALAYSNMVSLAFKAIQEQQAIIEQLKARLDAANL